MAKTTRKDSRLRATIRDQTGNLAMFKIGEILKKEGHITNKQLEDAIATVNSKGGFISSLLLRKGYIDEKTIPNLLSRRYNYPIVNFAQHEIDPELFDLMPYQTAKKYFAIPVRISRDDSIQIAMTEPTNTAAVDSLSKALKRSVKVSVAPEKDIIDAYRKYYKIEDEEYRSFFGKPLQDVQEHLSITDIENIGDLLGAAAEDVALTPVEEKQADHYQASDAPIIKLVNSILVKAVEDGVSDVHIEPFENTFQVRYRVDGALYKSMNLPLEIRNALTSRLKIISSLDITERRVPQDGRIKMKFGPREVDFRVSTLPTLHGESIVLRILDKNALNIDLGALGMAPNDYKKFLGCIQRPTGMILVTGPTGSGKTTTLYSALNYLNKEDVKILTVEDPVEFNFKGFNQVNVNKEAGLTFARALKAFLRQDPDICMIGEIRDLETGNIATEAAMTGHLVFSTLHTNDCPGTVSRLVDMGIPPYVVAASLTLVTAQRLLRRICPKCKIPVTKIHVNELLEAGFSRSEVDGINLFKGQGCPHCFNTGYRGRVGVFEVMEMTNQLAQAIVSGVPEFQLRKNALQDGMLTLRQDALTKVKEELTTLDEVLNETVLQQDAIPAFMVESDVLVFEHGQDIFKAGEVDSNFYKLVDGRLAVIKDNEKIDEISENNTYFGELNGLVKGRRNVTIRSQGRSIVKIYSGENLFDTLDYHPEMYRQITTKLIGMLHENKKKMQKAD